jgi:hypothetical protein
LNDAGTTSEVPLFCAAFAFLRKKNASEEAFLKQMINQAV